MALELHAGHTSSSEKGRRVQQHHYQDEFVVGLVLWILMLDSGRRIVSSSYSGIGRKVQRSEGVSVVRLH